MPSYVDAINQVLKHEGGYVNNPADRGGRTNYGITQAVYEAFIGRKLVGPATDAPKGQPMSEAESVMRNMPPGNAIQIYKKNYWDKVGGDKIKRYTIAYALFDQGVNFGPSVAVKRAQKVLGLSQDGAVGPKTIAALNSTDEKKFLDAYLAESRSAYNRIVANNPSQSVFINGWLARVNSIQSYVSNWFGSINATTVGIGVGVMVTVAIAGYFAYKYFAAKQGAFA